MPARLFPVFQDREELAGSGDLPSRIQEALQQSRNLIVICSPNAAQSRWVNEEIRLFKQLGREAHVLALIVAGEPGAGDDPDTKSLECFPAALTHRIGPDGTLTDGTVEPLAADAREGKDNRPNCLILSHLR